MRVLIALLTGLLLAGCSDDLEDQQRRLEKFVQSNRIGSHADVWLVKTSSVFPNDRVALIFGFMDDFEFCYEIAELYMKKYPGDLYACAYAN